MASINGGSRGVYATTLTANTVDTVTFTNDALTVEVYTNGAAAMYVTVDGTAPTVGGGSTWELPAVTCVRSIPCPNPGAAPVVKLISAGTPTYSVTLGA